MTLAARASTNFYCKYSKVINKRRNTSESTSTFLYGEKIHIYPENERKEILYLLHSTANNQSETTNQLFLIIVQSTC